MWRQPCVWTIVSFLSFHFSQRESSAKSIEMLKKRRTKKIKTILLQKDQCFTSSMFRNILCTSIMIITQTRSVCCLSIVHGWRLLIAYTQYTSWTNSLYNNNKWSFFFSRLSDYALNKAKTVIGRLNVWNWCLTIFFFHLIFISNYMILCHKTICVFDKLNDFNPILGIFHLDWRFSDNQKRRNWTGIQSTTTKNGLCSKQMIQFGNTN